MKECINCKAILEDDELFCHECGTKQEIQEGNIQVEEVQESGSKKCIHCGETIETDCMFCPFCGMEQKEEIHEIVAKVPEIVKDHLSRILLNPGKWVATIIFPNKYPKSAFQLLTNKEDGFVINVALEESRGEGELISRIKQSTYYAKFIVNDLSEKDFFANMKLNSEEDAIKILSGLLHDVYEQSFIAAPRYETDMGEDETVTPTVEIKCKKCIHCGESIEVDSMFCPFCGKVQAAEEEKSEEPQHKPVKAKPEQSKASKSSAPPQPEQDQPEEELTIEEEEKKKSKAWLWIIFVLLIAGWAGWYFLNGYVNGSEVAAPVEEVADSEVEESDYEGPDDEEYESGPSTKLAFLEKFYQEGRLDADYIKQKVTPLVLDRLRKAYGGDCKYGDCLGTWVFLAFPQGADAKIVDGPFISETSRPGIFKVDYVYSYYKDSSKSNETRTVYLTVVKSDGEFLISDFDIEEYNSEENNQSDEDTSNGSITMAGKVSDYGIHMVLDVQGADVTGYYYYDSQGSGNRVTLKGSITEGILTLYKYDADGNNTGHFEGAFNGVSYQGRNVNYSRDEALPFSVEIVN